MQNLANLAASAWRLIAIDRAAGKRRASGTLTRREDKSIRIVRL
jgi:hypothetical protein